MIRGLQRFFGALDEAGVRSSPAERIDALRAVERVGIEDPARFRQALRATLVKRASQRAAFDEVFARTFAPPERARRRRRRRRGAGAGEAGERSRLGRSSASTRGSVPRQAPEPARKARGGSSRDRKDDEPLRLARTLRDLRQGRRQRWSRLRHVHVDPATRGGPFAPPRASDDARFRSLRRGRGEDGEAALAREVRRLIERLRLRTGRRLRATTRGRPYLRRLFRDSLRTGGVPFRIPRRRPRRRTPRVVLLVDVSWSTAFAAGLFLEMACEFLRPGRQTRVLLFVDRAVDATELVSRWAERGKREPFDRVLASVPGLNADAPSDYGRVFHALLDSPWRPRGRSTVLVVLGDGRTNVFDPLDWALEEIAASCGAALWLVPEAVSRWGTGDSALGRYLRHVDSVVEIGDLAGLALGVAELLRRVG